MIDKKMLASIRNGMIDAADALYPVSQALQMMEYNYAASKIQQQAGYIRRLAELLDEQLQSKTKAKK